MKLFLFSVLSIFLFISCIDKPQQLGQDMSMYYWKTTFQLDSVEEAFLNSNKVEHIYCRFFDLTLDKQKKSVIPIANLEWNQRAWAWNITPVIFIKNEIWSVANDSMITSLASQTLKQIHAIAEENKIELNSCQLDCDWTVSTKDKYFDFIKKCRELEPEWNWSATIRLHQVKYIENTGIPPVNQGMLMYYNMGKISSDFSNSILDNEIGESYLSNLANYPMDLSLALPIYSWAIQVRNQSVVQLISEWDQSTLAVDTVFHQIDANRYECISAGFYHGAYLRKGDQIKLEIVQEKDLIQASKLLHQYYPTSFVEVALFDLDSKHITNFDEQFLSSFSKISKEK